MSAPSSQDHRPHSSESKPESCPPIKVWILHDGRAGHISQLQGLLKALTTRASVDAHWFDAKSMHFKLKNLLKPSRSQASPDIVIGAGHSTHKSLLLSARAHRAVSCVIMKPSLPLSVFDCVICPQHDGLTNSDRVFNTQGPITKVSPSDYSKTGAARTGHLMMLGGPSKHYVWNDALIRNQIRSICQARPDISWSLSDSPRTPEGFIASLDQQNIPNLRCFSYQDKSFGPLEEVLCTSAFTWVTPDSMSMIYESLSAKAPTALFKMESKAKAANKRICRHVSQVLEAGTVIDFDRWQSELDINFYPPMPPVMDEAGQAAHWLLARYQTLRTN